MLEFCGKIIYPLTGIYLLEYIFRTKTNTKKPLLKHLDINEVLMKFVFYVNNLTASIKHLV